MIRIAINSPNFKLRRASRFSKRSQENPHNDEYRTYRLQEKKAGAWVDVTPLMFSLDELNSELSKRGFVAEKYLPNGFKNPIKPAPPILWRPRSISPSPTPEQVLDWIVGRKPQPEHGKEVQL